jgi:hypothetical protein
MLQKPDVTDIPDDRANLKAGILIPEFHRKEINQILMMIKKKNLK